MALLPSFDALPIIPGLGLRHSWGVFGDGDRLGTINLLTPERVAVASRLVSSGEVVSLDLPLDQPDPPLFGRQRYTHEVFALNRNEMDDRLDNFFPQGSTQWDALGHVRCREFGYWGGRTEDPTAEVCDLGIDNWARHGIVGRGVLVDVASWAENVGKSLDALEPTSISSDDLEATLAYQGEHLSTGDIVCIRTGWVRAYRGLDPLARTDYAQRTRCIGLRADEAMARFLWDAHVAAVCCDNPAVEATPGDPAVGSLHRRLIPLLGMALGELFDFEALMPFCRSTKRWSFMFVAAPLNLPRGLGSPGNAVAIL